MIALSHMVKAAREGDPVAAEAVIRRITPGLRLLHSCRLPGADSEFWARNALKNAIQEIRAGSIVSADDLITFLRCALSFESAKPVRRVLPTRSTEAFIRRVQDLSDRKREILYRRYELAQSNAQICSDMRATEE